LRDLKVSFSWIILGEIIILLNNLNLKY